MHPTFSNHTILLHGSLGFRPYGIIPKESTLTHTMCIIGSWYLWSPIGYTEAVSASGDQYLLVSGTTTCTSWVIRSCNSLYDTHVSFLAVLCLLFTLGIPGLLGEFLLNPASSTLWIFSRVHLAEAACHSAWSITSCVWSWEYSCCTLLSEIDLFSSTAWQ